MTPGGSRVAVDATAASAPLAVLMQLRRPLSAPLSPLDELRVRALGDVIPGADHRLELCVRCVHLPVHRRLLGFFPDNVSGDLLEPRFAIWARLHRRSYPCDVRRDSLIAQF